jgi:pimeloyl-ACP methyl ester carboxylesterase
VYTDRWATINRIRLHYQEWGRPETPPLLLLHGLTQQSHTFDFLAARFSDRLHCLAPDLRGRGESNWAPPETYTLLQYVADVLGFLTALSVPAVHAFGTSMGGLVALSLAGIAPQRVLTLGLNDIGPAVDPRGAERIAGYTSTVPESFPSLDSIVAWALEQYPWLRRLPEGDLTESLRWAVREGPDGRWRFKFDPAIGRARDLSPAMARAATAYWWSVFGSLRCPVLLIRAGESDVLTARTAEEMARLQPGMLRAEVAGMWHAPTLKEPEALAALESFYGRLAPRGPAAPLPRSSISSTRR